MSVLQDITAGIAADVVNNKAAKAAGLTPVAGETATTVSEVALRISDEVAFLGQEAVEGVIRTLRATAVESSRLADELETGLGKVPNAPVVSTRKPTKQEVRLMGADPVVIDEAGSKPLEQFKDEFAALTAAAQAATFKATATGEWTCPTHGATTQQLTSRKGRTYRACTQCKLFEKE